MPKEKELTLRQKRFLEHYLKSGNGAESVRLAKYKAKTPEDTANNLLKNPIISDKIRQLRQNIDESIEKVTKEIDSLAFGIPQDKLTHNVKARMLELRAKIDKLIGADSTLIDNRTLNINTQLEEDEDKLLEDRINRIIAENEKR